MNDIKREAWSEADVSALPVGEHHYFDRKSGQLLDEPEFRHSLAKVIGALANSGGGHLVLGVTDAGVFDGVLPFRGRTSTREWLEQIIPSLLSYPLEDFRVHEVIPASPSTIPVGRVAIVVDVGDSALAPHQTEGRRSYFYREGGHSKPAPHFYLETLRNRLTNPTLVASPVELRRLSSYESDGGVFVECKIVFRIRNNGRIAAYKWALLVESLGGIPAGRLTDYRWRHADFPRRLSSRTDGFRLDNAILPSLELEEKQDFGFLLRASASDRAALLADLEQMLGAAAQLKYRVVTETSPGEPTLFPIASLIDYESFLSSCFPLAV